MRSTRKKRFASKHVLAFMLALGMLLSAALPSLATEAKYDKATNTAFITGKSAEWTDFDNFRASLTLSVNGTETYSPLDVVICLDRSGSMDMNYAQGGAAFASCPCLNQQHFYLDVIDDNVADPGIGDDQFAVHDNLDGTITVYNPDTQQWAQLDTSNHISLYYEFGTIGDQSDMKYTKYHFKMDGDQYVRISSWDDSDIRHTAGDKGGIWDHGKESEGCYDRWSEAKRAVDEFTQKLLGYTDESGTPLNRVALVPFSMRDTIMVNTLNSSSYEPLRKWLIEKNNQNPDENTKFFSDATGAGVGVDGKLTGTYNSVVDWTVNSGDVTNMLPRLFTTACTDYVYAMSRAYNLLAGRSVPEKEQRRAVVVFLSDGRAWPYAGSATGAFFNGHKHVSAMADALKEDTNKRVDKNRVYENIIADKPVENLFDIWTQTSTSYQRHEIDPAYLLGDPGDRYVYGLNAQLITVAYMLDKQEYKNRLKNMASNAESYIEVDYDSETTQGHLSRKLLASSIFPGGRDCVLRDEISKYFYIADGAVLPTHATRVSDGAQIPTKITVEGPANGTQTLVWEIGDLYKLAGEKGLEITVPLWLREQYRTVDQMTYYPTNADTSDGGKDIYDSKNGPDDPDTGAKLYYTDPDDDYRYDTIGTPKLPVPPTTRPPTTTAPTDPTYPPDPTDPPTTTEPTTTEPTTTEPTTTEPATTEPDTTVPPDTTEPTAPPYIPGGIDPDVPPIPTTPGHRVVPDENGVLIELDNDGVPTGSWTYDEEEEVWVYVPLELLDELPMTGFIKSYLPVFALALIGSMLVYVVVYPFFKTGKRQAKKR